MQDTFLEEALLRDYNMKKANGQLKSEQRQRRTSTALAPCPLSSCSSDSSEAVRVGDVLHLFNPSSGCVLADDVSSSDPRPGREHTVAVSASKHTDSCARNTFVLRRFPRDRLNAPAPSTGMSQSDAGDDDGVLRYGDEIAIMANAMALGCNEAYADGGPKPMYLKSLPISTMDFAKQSRHQEVMLQPGLDRYAAWRVTPLAPATSAKLNGTVVAQNSDDVALLHSATHQALCCETPENTVVNDFGTEREVSTHNYASFAASSRSECIQKGIPEMMKERPLLQQNEWRLCNGGGGAIKQLPTSRSYELGNETADVILREKVLEPNVDLNHLYDMLERNDETGADRLSPQQVNLALAKVGAPEFTQAELQQLERAFKSHGKVDYHALVQRASQLNEEQAN